MAEVAILSKLFADILRLIAELRALPDPGMARTARLSCVPEKAKGEVRLDHNQTDIPDQQ